MMNFFQIYWFSGTGNTLVVARILSSELEKLGARVELLNMGTAPNLPAWDSTLIFCWPVYAYGMPRLVSRFVAKLPRGENPAYMVCTMGGHAGGALNIAGRLLSGRGFKVLGGLEILMPNNYTGGRIPESESTQRLIADAEVGIQEFANRVVKGQDLPWQASMLTKLVSWMASRAFYLSLPFSRKSFKVTADCTGCNVCAGTCPATNISMSDKRPMWGRNCEQCLRCLHICPVAAIDFMNAIKNGRPQYLAPGVTLQDFKTP